MNPHVPFDVTKPNIARVYDFLLGGKDNFAADREAAAKLLKAHPLAGQLARENRTFLTTAVRYAAGQGVDQFIDAGSGLPTPPNTHEVARSEQPDARVAYVDNDPMVISHARALVAKDEGIAVVAADLCDPEPLLASPELTSVIDLSQPVCVLLVSVLHFVDYQSAKAAVEAFIRRMSAGSYLVISVATADPDYATELGPDIYTPSAAYNHLPEQIRAFFGDLELVSPGLTDACSWQPGQPPFRRPPRPAIMLAGVARKP